MVDSFHRLQRKEHITNQNQSWAKKLKNNNNQDQS